MNYQCGDNKHHYYDDGNSCVCGQVPYSIFFAANCTCGGSRYISPRHKPDCAYVAWCKKRNSFVQQHPNLKPPLDRVKPEVCAVSDEVKKGETA